MWYDNYQRIVIERTYDAAVKFVKRKKNLNDKIHKVSFKMSMIFVYFFVVI